MNGPFDISEETQLRMAAYNRDVANMIFDAVMRPASKPLPGMSDEDHDAEYRALDQFYSALATFRSKTEDCAALSELRRDKLLDLLKTLKDGRPDRGAWEEEINAKRRGWE